MPEELKDVFDAEQYRKQQEYKKVNDRFSLLTSSFSFLVILLMLFLGGFSLVDGWARGITNHPVLIVLVFFAILGLGADLMSTPFSLYDTFVIEERFGFNKTTPKTLLMDKLKGWMLGAIIGGGLLALIVWFYQVTGSYSGCMPGFWPRCFRYLWPCSILPSLFRCSTSKHPWKKANCVMRSAHSADKVGFRLDNIYVIDGSKRSTKANAYFTGLGTQKTDRVI